MKRSERLQKPGLPSGPARKALGRAVAVARHAWKRAMIERMPETAAAAAYYALFSLFPLLLITVALGSYFLDGAYVMSKVLENVSTFIPNASKELIIGNMTHILDRRKSVGAIGVLGLLWGASGVFYTIQAGLNRAWPESHARAAWKAQAVAIIMVVAFFPLLVLFSIAQAVAGLVYEWLSQRFDVPFLYEILSRVVIYLFIFCSFACIYKWVPKADIRRHEALGGALFATVFSQLFTAGFGWYLGSGHNQYNLVYGTLGTLVAFMFWIFAMSFVLFGGGHIGAAIARERRGVEKR